MPLIHCDQYCVKKCSLKCAFMLMEFVFMFVLYITAIKYRFNFSMYASVNYSIFQNRRWFKKMLVLSDGM